MNRSDAWAHLAYAVDDSLSQHSVHDIPDPSHQVRLVVWMCGAEPLTVAVWSYLGVRLDDDDAASLATDLLQELGWFAGSPTEPDYIL